MIDSNDQVDEVKSKMKLRANNSVFPPLGRWLCLAAVMSVTLRCAPTRGQEPALDPALAAQYFSEATEVCTRDGGRLWGVSLCGPMLFADPVTRAVAANQPDKEGRLRPQGEVFTGALPPEVVRSEERRGGKGWR